MIRIKKRISLPNIIIPPLLPFPAATLTLPATATFPPVCTKSVFSIRLHQISYPFPSYSTARSGFFSVRPHHKSDLSDVEEIG
ncbi:hypothetical protein L484_010514 [Morus notabilis]|uniref:Uncharacterized protein n=1 Tax=Morus notabilis TaxID=981085 RepID=W9QXC2_9ROSA|nr:hypothetical protein L484_010514 [Morus notabilis]